MKNILRKISSACCSMVLTLGLTQLASLNANAAKFVGLGNGGHQCAYISLIQQLYSCKNLKDLIKAGTIRANCNLAYLFDLMDKAEEEWISDMPKKESDLTQEEINKLQKEVGDLKPLEKRWVPISETQAKNWYSIEAEELGNILKDIYNAQQDTIDEAFMNLLGNSAAKDHMMFISSDTIRHIVAEEDLRDFFEISIDLSELNGGLLDCFSADLLQNKDISSLANLFNEKDNVFLSIPQELEAISKGDWDFEKIYSKWGYETKSISVNTGGHFITWVLDELKDKWRLIDDSKLDPIEYSFEGMKEEIKKKGCIASLMYSKRQDVALKNLAEGRECPQILDIKPEFFGSLKNIPLFFPIDENRGYELKQLDVVNLEGEKMVCLFNDSGSWSILNQEDDVVASGLSFDALKQRIDGLRVEKFYYERSDSLHPSNESFT